MKILVIRRDNIGDLVCSTPLIRALRQQLPDANIQALVTHYNAEVLARNPDLDVVYSYQKAKHRGPGEGRFGIYWDRLKTILALRRSNFDWVLLPGGAQASSLRFARMVAPKRVLVRDDQDRVAGPHEVEQCAHLLVRMGLAYAAPPSVVFPDMTRVEILRKHCEQQLGFIPSRFVGVHISARKVSQRWSASKFAAFVRHVTQVSGSACLLFWAPGAKDDPKHPGDDEKAKEVLAESLGCPIVQLPTQGLSELIAGLMLCQSVLCADGGAMHLAAALGKPLVCLFGDSDPARWGPWGTRFQVVQAETRDVRDLSLSDVLGSWQKLEATRS